MGVPNSEADYTIATTRRETTKVHKNMWWHWEKKNCNLTLILLKWRIWWAPNNASRWQMGFNSAFKGLIPICTLPRPALMQCVSLRTLRKKKPKGRKYQTHQWTISPAGFNPLTILQITTLLPFTAAYTITSTNPTLRLHTKDMHRWRVHTKEFKWKRSSKIPQLSQNKILLFSLQINFISFYYL